jgi:hypothetical protein
MPPPTVKGTKSDCAVRRTVSSSVARPSCVAVMSSSTISSAPSRVARGERGGIAGVDEVDELDAFDDAAVAARRGRR